MYTNPRQIDASTKGPRHRHLVLHLPAFAVDLVIPCESDFLNYPYLFLCFDCCIGCL
jgi:hypothetical protein